MSRAIFEPTFARSAPSPTALNRTALTGIYGFAFCAPWSVTAGALAQSILLVAAVAYGWAHRFTLVREPLIWLTFTFIVYVTLRGWVAANAADPEIAAGQWTAVWDWVRAGPTAIFLIAYGLAAAGEWLRHAVGMLVAMAVGTLLNLLRGFSPETVIPTLTGSARYTFEEMHSIVALQIVAVLLLTCAFMPVILCCRKYRRMRAALITAGLLTMIIFMVALIVTKSRSGWLALVIALCAMAALALWAGRGRIPLQRERAISVTLMAALIAAMATAAFGGRIADRFRPVVDTMVQVAELPFEGDVSELGNGSLAIRAAYWDVAIRMFSDAPLFGYGPDDPRDIAEKYPVAPQIEGRSDNLHSSYSQFLLSFGLVGALSIVAVLGITIGITWRLLATGGAAAAIGIYVLAFVVAFAVWGIANQRLHRFDLIQLYAITIGIPLARFCAARLGDSRPVSKLMLRR